MTAATLRSHTAKDLAQMARQHGIAGWHSMRKEELVSELVRIARNRSLSKPTSNGNGTTNGGARKANPRVQQKIDQLKRKLANAKNLALCTPEHSQGPPVEDRLVVMVRDPYWLHAFWELSQRSVDRAQAAMGQHWHTAKPVLRLFTIQEAGSSTLERDIVIHGGVSNWYIDVQNPPCEFRMEIGYLSENDSFYCLARSNTVQTPPAGTSDAVDDNWKHVAEQADRIFAMSGGYSPQGTSRELQELLEERLRRPLGSPMATRFGNGANGLMQTNGAEMPFAVDAEVIIYGAADRNAHVTLKGEPVQLRADGTFAVRVSLPDQRQVIPIVASSGDGVEQRTIILAVERNTKVMETQLRDATVR
ncbi:MAG: DUF4912 domain-containing protein [Planctomycetota bacterium]